MSDYVDWLAVALAGGVTVAGGLFLLALGGVFLPGWEDAVVWIGRFYVGYDIGLVGGLVGAVWGFADFFVGLYVFGRLYRFFKDSQVV